VSAKHKKVLLSAVEEVNAVSLAIFDYYSNDIGSGNELVGLVTFHWNELQVKLSIGQDIGIYGLGKFGKGEVDLFFCGFAVDGSPCNDWSLSNVVFSDTN
jgi:hypothetical protein